MYGKHKKAKGDIMGKNDSKKTSKFSYFIVFIILIAALIFVVYAKKKGVGESGSYSDSAAPESGSAAQPADVEADYTLAEIIRSARGWQPLMPELYGTKAPDFTVKSLDGKEIKLSDYAGKEVVVVFWASWCGYCVQKIPHLNILQADMKDDVVVIGISSESLRTVKDFVASRKMDYQVAHSSNGYSGMGSFYPRITRGGTSLPASMHIDKNGTIKIICIGSLSVTEMKRIVRAEK